jgi:hypothetical protein
LRLSKALKEGKNCRFAASGMADERCHFSGRDNEIQFVENGLIGDVAVDNVMQNDFAFANG